MVSWMRCHCPQNKEIRALAVWGWARYLSVTETHRNIESLRMSGVETFGFFETWIPELGTNPRSPAFRECSSNHCTRGRVRLLGCGQERRCDPDVASAADRITLPQTAVPINTRHSNNDGLMLGQRQRRWPNIKPSLFECLAFTAVPDY